MCADILLRLGLVDPRQLEAAQAASASRAVPLTEWLVRAGAIDEVVLVDALAGALHLPTVTSAELAAVADETLQLVPADLMVERRAVPIAVDGEMLTVAFADATDAEAVAEISFFAGRDVARAVAPPSAICSLLERRFGVRVLALGSMDGAASSEAGEPVNESLTWRRICGY